MTLTKEQRAIVAREIERDCLSEAGEDAAAGLQAARIILSTQTDEWLEAQYRKLASEQISFSMDHGFVDGSGKKINSAALSLDGNDRRPQTWVDEYGVSRVVQVPVSNEEQLRLNAAQQRRLNREVMRATLATLDAALSTMNARGAALAILSR